jgi:glycerol-3-phosphate O-acyltransferase
VFIPLYILIPVLVLAAVALAERILLPGARVVVRRKVRRLVDDLNDRLRLRLQPFKLTKKRIVEEMLMHDPEVVQAAKEYREANDLSWDEVTSLVRAYAREIVPRFNVYLYYRPSHWVARHISRFLYRVRVSFLDTRAVAAVDTESSIIFVMNHRSNFDYLLVSYIVARISAVSYAVGEWARVWPLDTLIRRMGGYFVRRNASDPLYRKVLERYVQLSTESGVTQGIFPEGRLTRDGRLQEPRLGLLNYLLKRFDPAGPRDLIFVPVGLNYDRVFEDRTQTLEVAGTRPRVSAMGAAAVTLRFVGKNLWLLVRGRLHRFGVACVNFGVPLSIKEYIARLGKDFRRMSPEEYRAEVLRLATVLMGEIARAVPVTPVPLVARALLRLANGAVGEKDLETGVAEEMAALQARGAALSHPRSPAAKFVKLGVRMLGLRRMVMRTDGGLVVNPDERVLLAYYANSIAHLFPEDTGSLVSS